MLIKLKHLKFPYTIAIVEKIDYDSFAYARNYDDLKHIPFSSTKYQAENQQRKKFVHKFEMNAAMARQTVHSYLKSFITILRCLTFGHMANKRLGT